MESESKSKIKKRLEIRNLSVSFEQYQRGFQKTSFYAIRDLNVDIHAGEIVAVVGASGSGKSLLAHAILGILPYNASVEGELYFQGEKLTQERKEELRGKEIVFVPQSVSYLDPLMQVGKQVRKGRKVRQQKERMLSVFQRYHLPEGTERKYPFQLSGGMTRRVLIATAMMENSRLIIADEPTPGIQEDMARRVLGHFREMAEEGAGILFITHDLELAVKTADRIVVFYAGTTIEEAKAQDFESEETLRHPYSKALWRAMPSHGFVPVSGSQPMPNEITSGCPFFPRCGHHKAACRETISWREFRGGHVRCLMQEEAREGSRLGD